MIDLVSGCNNPIPPQKQKQNGGGAHLPQILTFNVLKQGSVGLKGSQQEGPVNILPHKIRMGSRDFVRYLRGCALMFANFCLDVLIFMSSGQIVIFHSFFPNQHLDFPEITGFPFLRYLKFIFFSLCNFCSKDLSTNQSIAWQLLVRSRSCHPPSANSLSSPPSNRAVFDWYKTIEIMYNFGLYPTQDSSHK